MPGEPAFLLYCVRRFLRPDAPLSCPPDLDWTRLLALAREHSVEPAIYWVLSKDPLPPAVLDQLRESCGETARHNLALSAELARLLALFAQTGIEVLPLKGPTLAAELYGNLALRAFGGFHAPERPTGLQRPPRQTRARTTPFAAGMITPCAVAYFWKKTSSAARTVSR